MSSKSVILIGGGLAGLSAGVALAEAGFRVRLFEKRPFLGGRATSYVLPSGEHVDNCQHVTLGCCTNLTDFYNRIGASRKIRTYDRLTFADPSGRRGTLRVSPLPAPFHLSPSFLKFPLLSSDDKRAIARAMMAILRIGRRSSVPNDSSSAPTEIANGLTMLEWLRRHRQTPSAIERFWRVVLVSALDEELDRMDASYGVDVFWKAFLANRAGYEIGIPMVPLAELYDGCRAGIESRGGEVILRAAVRGIEVSENEVRCVRFDDGRTETADYYVAAIPHESLSALFATEVVEGEPLFSNLRNLRNSPITSIHLWFDGPVMDEPFLTVLECASQWIFNKSALHKPARSEGHPGAERLNRDREGQYLQIVISASYAQLNQSREEIIALTFDEADKILDLKKKANLLKATVIKETAATFSPAPGCDRWRPKQITPIARLYLAGDWTATGWPATMEGAVRSGYLAAEAVLANTGASRKLLQPDLPVQGLARIFSRLPGTPFYF
ncbi:MAG TPA: hydroxysqualene dehydroxylase HpnE [Candidatus Dormibacteraeota bacterium]|nr:hydroxysqualene dehydroxylase HpnE [Candidatus Dormibacteraeota bacterium]